jgi:acyl-coenzyme A synthetase/AMP-(fatty) acid ligase
LQILLRAVLTGASLVLPDGPESTTDFLARAGQCGVTHISGTPSHWRRALMSSSTHLIDPKYIRLSGEIADETILRRLRSTYPKAKIVHAFATTEAGVAFEVDDGVSGVPPEVIAAKCDVEMKIVDGTLRIRSSRAASHYLGEDAPTLKDAEGFVDTGDILKLREGRYHFAGRSDGRINVGGFKVHPEEIEAIINQHPKVEMSLVRAKGSPITGAVVVADVVLRTGQIPKIGDVPALQNDIQRLCRNELSSHKIPATIYFVPSLAIAESGKMMRGHA